MCTREGRNPSVNLEYYHGWGSQISWTRLTMSILRGDRKQSVRDAGLMFNPNFLKWLYSNGTNKKLNMWKLGILQMMKEGLLKNAQGWINNSHTTSLMTSCRGTTTPGTSHCLKSIGSHDYILVLHYVYQYHIIYIILIHTGQSTMWGASHGRQQPHSSLQ